MERGTKTVPALSWPVVWQGDRDKEVNRYTRTLQTYMTHPLEEAKKKKGLRCVKIEMDTFLRRTVRNRSSELLGKLRLERGVGGSPGSQRLRADCTDPQWKRACGMFRDSKQEPGLMRKEGCDT